MSTVQNVIPSIIVVSASDWHAWNAAKSRATAAAKEADALRAVMGIPTTEELARALGATAETPATAVVMDGNNVPLGKLSVFWKDAYAVKAGFSSRLS